MILGQSSWYATDEEAAINALAENDIKEVADVLDPAKVINTVKNVARKAVPSIAPGDSGMTMATGESAPIWPWILGLAVLGGGGYWFWRRSKRHKKHKRSR